jgi:O-antigen/teichoic acid export membrane protein
MFAFAVPIALLVCLLAPLIVRVVFGPEYQPSILPLQILAWSVPLCLLRDVPSAALLANAREDQFFRLTASGAVLNLALNVFLIPRYGMVGAGIATLAAEGSRMIIALAYARSHGFRLRDLNLFARVTLAMLPIAALLLFARPDALWVALPVGALGYAAALVAVGGVRIRRGEFPALNI